MHTRRQQSVVVTIIATAAKSYMLTCLGKCQRIQLTYKAEDGDIFRLSSVLESKTFEFAWKEVNISLCQLLKI